ncbi:MAG: SRPBCC family protein [Pseudomonadota bacterium]
MDRETECELIDELLALKDQKALFLDDAVSRNPVVHYTDEKRFALERDRIFRRTPIAAAHTSELDRPGAFLRREVAGLPVLLTRDKTGRANAFLNACRHRGTRLVDDEKGCKNRFSCPYHAWTYANTGDLIVAPHFEAGFEGVEKSDLGLKKLQCEERFGFVWVTAEPESAFNTDTYFEDLAVELDNLAMGEMVIAQQDVAIREANWKILVEGGIEAYHFKVAHRKTIGPYFEDNLSSYKAFGPHLRSVLPRASITDFHDVDREAWRVRDHAQVLYTLFPSSALLAQQDHIAWISQEPLSAGYTRVRLSTLVPAAHADKEERWAQSHEITKTTLDEDFVIGESIQSTLLSGANENMLFGRFEGALHAFNQSVSRFID